MRRPCTRSYYIVAVALLAWASGNSAKAFVPISENVGAPRWRVKIDANAGRRPPPLRIKVRFKAGADHSNTLLYLWSKDEEMVGKDRIKACIPYVLPLLDGEMFGRYIYERVPPLGFLDSLFIGPLYDFYSQIPLLGLIIFLVLTLGTRGDTEMNRAVRFNAQQAALIDVSLIFPELIGSAFEGEDIPRYLVEPCMNFVWYTYMAMVLYSIYTNLRGKKPDQIPWISGFAEIMVGPF